MAVGADQADDGQVGVDAGDVVVGVGGAGAVGEEEDGAGGGTGGALEDE